MSVSLFLTIFLVSSIASQNLTYVLGIPLSNAVTKTPATTNFVELSMGQTEEDHTFINSKIDSDIDRYEIEPSTTTATVYLDPTTEVYDRKVFEMPALEEKYDENYARRTDYLNHGVYDGDFNTQTTVDDVKHTENALETSTSSISTTEAEVFSLKAALDKLLFDPSGLIQSAWQVVRNQMDQCSMKAMDFITNNLQFEDGLRPDKAIQIVEPLLINN